MIRDELAAILGASAVAEAGGHAAATLRRPEDAAALVAFARDRGLRLHPWNGGEPPGAALPAKTILVTASAELGGEPFIAAEDYYLEISAAATWPEVRKLLNPTRLWLPFAAAGGAAMTVGETMGRFPANAFAPLYGEFPRFLFGIWFLTDQGTIVPTGRRTIKGVTGYDLPKLFLGARGRVGLITRVRLRLFGRPRGAACWRIAGATMDKTQTSTGACLTAAADGLWVYAEGTAAFLEKTEAGLKRIYGKVEPAAAGENAADVFAAAVETAPRETDAASPVEGPWSNLFI